MMLGRKVYRLDTMVMGRVDNRSLMHTPHPAHAHEVKGLVFSPNSWASSKNMKQPRATLLEYCGSKNK